MIDFGLVANDKDEAELEGDIEIIVCMKADAPIKGLHTILNAPGVYGWDNLSDSPSNPEKGYVEFPIDINAEQIQDFCEFVFQNVEGVIKIVSSDYNGEQTQPIVKVLKDFSL